jgi:phosphopantothenoylcysteine synthetase/decarboxylase
MNTVMWLKPVVQSHVEALRQRGAHILDPVSGHLACGEQGVGAMADPQAIATLVADALKRRG